MRGKATVGWVRRSRAHPTPIVARHKKGGWCCTIRPFRILKPEPRLGAGRAELALAGLHARVLLVDDIDAAATADDAAILVAGLRGTEGVTHLHSSGPILAKPEPRHAARAGVGYKKDKAGCPALSRCPVHKEPGDACQSIAANSAPHGGRRSLACLSQGRSFVTRPRMRPRVERGPGLGRSACPVAANMPVQSLR